MSDLPTTLNDSNAATGNTVGNDFHQTINHYHGPQPPTPEPAQLAPIETAIRPPRVWLSPVDSPNRDALATELRLRGIFVERDETLAAADLASCLSERDFCIVYITTANFSRAEETVLRWLHQHPETTFFILIEHVSREKLYYPDSSYLAWKHLLDRAKNSFILPADAPIAAVVAIAQRLAQSIIVPHVRRYPALELVFWSYAAVPATYHAHLALDWSDLNRGGQPDDMMWARGHGALLDVRQWLADKPQLRIHTAKLAYIPGFMFGSVFYFTAGFRLTVENAYTDSWWRYNPKAGLADDFLKVEPTPGTNDGGACSLELIIVATQSAVTIQEAITQHIIKELPTLSHRIHVAPNKQPEFTVESADQASAIIHSIFQVIRQRRCQTTHLFGSIPVALALMVGQHINGLGYFCWHEYDRTKKIYSVDAFPLISTPL